MNRKLGPLILILCLTLSAGKTCARSGPQWWFSADVGGGVFWRNETFTIHNEWLPVFGGSFYREFGPGILMLRGSHIMGIPFVSERNEDHWEAALLLGAKVRYIPERPPGAPPPTSLLLLLAAGPSWVHGENCDGIRIDGGCTSVTYLYSWYNVIGLALDGRAIFEFTDSFGFGVHIQQNFNSNRDFTTVTGNFQFTL